MMSGCGNRFAIFDGRVRPRRFDSEDVRRIAAPDSGVDVDQVVCLESSIRADAFMRIWNRDGSVSAACGNAARCVAWLLIRGGGTDHVKLETEAGVLDASREDDMRISVDMGSPLLRWEEIPLARKMDTCALDLTIGPPGAPVLCSPGAVNMGNPHSVFFVPDLDATDVMTLGPLVEEHGLFPRRTNVGFAQILADDRLRLRVWERGAGLTKACGSGACASVVAACRQARAGRSATVITDGGDIHIDWRTSDDHVLMTGPVEFAASGTIGPLMHSLRA